jgi:hypothetical protein
MSKALTVAAAARADKPYCPACGKAARFVRKADVARPVTEARHVSEVLIGYARLTTLPGPYTKKRALKELKERCEAER